jgi:hypothetical protein
MCGKADSLMLTQYVRHSRQLNADIIYEVQQSVEISNNMYGKADI